MSPQKKVPRFSCRIPLLLALMGGISAPLHALEAMTTQGPLLTLAWRHDRHLPWQARADADWFRGAERRSDGADINKIVGSIGASAGITPQQTYQPLGEGYFNGSLVDDGTTDINDDDPAGPWRLLSGFIGVGGVYRIGERQSLVARGRIHFADGSTSSQSSSAVSAEGSIGWRQGNGAEALVVGLTYRGWNARDEFSIPLPLIEYHWRHAAWTGLLGFPRLATRWSPDTVDYHSWLSVVDGARHAMTEYVYLNNNWPLGFRIGAEYLLDYVPNARDEALSRFSYRAWLHTVVHWQGITLSGGPTYHGPERWYQGHVGDAPPDVRFNERWGGSLTMTWVY